MPVTLTDEQMDAIKTEMESGKRLPKAVNAVVPEIGLGQARQQMIAKYGQEGFRAIAMAARPIPSFERMEALVKALEPRLTNLEQVNAMISNLASAVVELDRIKDNLSS